jgi:hypothetical protein
MFEGMSVFLLGVSVYPSFARSGQTRGEQLVAQWQGFLLETIAPRVPCLICVTLL